MVFVRRLFHIRFNSLTFYKRCIHHTWCWARANWWEDWYFMASSNTHLESFLCFHFVSETESTNSCVFVVMSFPYKMPWWKTLITFMSFANHSYCVCCTLRKSVFFCSVPRLCCVCLPLWIYVYGQTNDEWIKRVCWMHIYWFRFILCAQVDWFTYATYYFLDRKQWQYFLFVLLLDLWTQRKIVVIDGEKLKWI